MGWTGGVTTLTDITNTDKFKELLTAPKPPIGVKPVEIKPPRDYHSIEYALIGMAINYLYRFKLLREDEHEEAFVYHGKMTAEQVTNIDIDTNVNLEQVITGAKATSKAYINGSDSLPTKAALDLARLELIVRSGGRNASNILPYLGEADTTLETDLENLLTVSEDTITATEYAIINPVLARNGLVADADFIIDNALIDTKTTVNPEFSDKLWRQLIGYLILLDIQSDKNRKTHGWTMTPPNKFGVYYTRSNDIQLLSTTPIYEQDNYNQLRSLIETEIQTN